MLTDGIEYFSIFTMGLESNVINCSIKTKKEKRKKKMDIKVFFVLLTGVILLGLGVKNFFYLERTKGSIIIFLGGGFLLTGVFLQMKINILLFAIVIVLYVALGSKKILKLYE